MVDCRWTIRSRPNRRNLNVQDGLLPFVLLFSTDKNPIGHTAMALRYDQKGVEVLP